MTTIETQVAREGAPKSTRKRAPRPTASQSAPVKTRKRAQWFALSIALVVIGTILSYVVFQSLGNTTTVFTTKSDIVRGQVIDANALSEIQIAADQSVDAFTVDEAKQLVGQYATVDLPAGSLLTSANTATNVGVPEGQSMVGVPLKPGQLPASALVAGDKVRLVASQALDAAGRPAADSSVPPVDAIVAKVTFDEVANLTVVDVLVPSAKAPELASRAAGGALALILDPAE